MVLRRTRYQLRAAEDRAEQLEGYLIALGNMDEFIRIIRDSANRDAARDQLLALRATRRVIEVAFGLQIRDENRLDRANGSYALTEKQTNQILELRLYQLTGLERDKITAEYRDLLATIKDLLDVLARESRVLELIKSELRAIKERHASPRLTEILPDEGEMNVEDLISNKGCIITLTRTHPVQQAHRCGRLPRAAPRRPRRDRHDHARFRGRRGRRFCRNFLHREHARLPHVFHARRALLRRKPASIMRCPR